LNRQKRPYPPHFKVDPPIRFASGPFFHRPNLADGLFIGAESVSGFLARKLAVISLFVCTIPIWLVVLVAVLLLR
jgi:hypothetical protein